MPTSSVRDIPPRIPGQTHRPTVKDRTPLRKQTRKGAACPKAAACFACLPSYSLPSSFPSPEEVKRQIAIEGVIYSRNKDCTGFLSEIGTKLRDWAVGQAGGSCYSRAALSSNDSKTRYSTEKSVFNTYYSVVKLLCTQIIRENCPRVEYNDSVSCIKDISLQSTGPMPMGREVKRNDTPKNEKRGKVSTGKRDPTYFTKRPRPFHSVSR